MTLVFSLLVMLLLLILIISLEITTASESFDPDMAVAHLQRHLWIAGLIAMVVFGAVAWYFAGRIAHPLKTISAAAEAIRRTGHEQIIPTFAGKDEVASLSRSLNVLVATLRTQQQSLHEANTVLEARVRQRTNQLAALYDILAMRSEVRDLPALLQQALERILRTARADTGSVFLLSQDETMLQLVAQVGQALPPNTTVPSDQPLAQEILAGTTYLQRSPLDYDANPLLGDPAETRKAALCLPLRFSERHLGIMIVYASHFELIDQEETDLLTSLAAQLAIVIENTRLRQQADQLAVLDERNRLARELHDSVTQGLYSAALFAEASLKQAELGNQEKSQAYISEVLASSRQALKEMRLLIHKLRPSSVEKEGLAQAIEQRLKAVEERSGISYELAIARPLQLEAAIEDTLYFMATEALNNALKHAQATVIQVEIAQSEQAVTMSIRDNGRGFDPAGAGASGGYGLTTLQERAAAQQGTLTINSTPGEGTLVQVTLPTADAVVRVNN
ncbi:MAG: GAF domain-containing protein [Anaerolineales bacterium]|nr:GAF domain-containing protein [Anaerolineales bacterium]